MDVQTLRQTINSQLGRYGAFGDNFWRFIKEEVGITHINKEKQSYLKKQITYEERIAKINAMLERAEFDDDKLSPSD